MAITYGEACEKLCKLKGEEAARLAKEFDGEDADDELDDDEIIAYKEIVNERSGIISFAQFINEQKNRFRPEKTSKSVTWSKFTKMVDEQGLNSMLGDVAFVREDKPGKFFVVTYSDRDGAYIVGQWDKDGPDLVKGDTFEYDEVEDLIGG